MSRLEAVLELVAVDSLSGHESSLAALVEGRLRASGALEVERVGDNVIARTTGRRATRVVIAGHLDTVPGDPSMARLDGDVLYGLGACDMKGSLAVMLELATSNATWPVEVTWLFYAREEIARRDSGLAEVARLRPDLVAGDVAILAEPTGGVVEAGCQGSLRVLVTLVGERAHSARPYAGRNAIHRAAPLLARVASFTPREVDLEGVRYVEQLQCVGIDGGVAANVVPDRVSVTLNHRVAPDRDVEAALNWLTGYLADVLETGDTVEVLDAAPPAPPRLGDARLAALVDATGERARAKVGWTDVATFQALGVPAANYGAGDPEVAHHRDERITRNELDTFAATLGAWLAGL